MKTPLPRYIVFALLFITGTLYAQPASYAEGGYLQTRLRKNGSYLPTSLPGFSIAVSGLEVSMYAGQFTQVPDSGTAKVNGGFWSVGYIWRSAPKENLKRFHYTVGGGIGCYGIGQSNGVHVNLHPGIQINITRSISLGASFYTGYNFFGKMQQQGGLLYENDYYKSTKGLFFHPSITLRLNTNPLAVMGGSFSRSSYWGGGMVTKESTSREGDYIVTRKSSYYLPAGNYVTDAIITSTNYINVFPKFLVGKWNKNDRAPSVAAGGGIAFRLGILAIDVEYLAGKIGFWDYANWGGSNQDYWKMRRTSAGLGINFFNIPFPFKGPSLVRFIFGTRLGVITLESNKAPYMIPPATTPSNPENMRRQKFASPFLAIEFGTLGLHLDVINNKNAGFGSGYLMGITYLIPLTGERFL